MRKSTSALHDAVLHELIEWLISNDNPSWQTIKKISEMTGYSEGHIQRIFFHHYKITIGVFCRKLKLCRIVTQIKNSDISLSEISLLNHFSSQQALTHYFKRESGCTPGKCRKRNDCNVCGDFYKIYLHTNSLFSSITRRN